MMGTPRKKFPPLGVLFLWAFSVTTGHRTVKKKNRGRSTIGRGTHHHPCMEHRVLLLCYWCCMERLPPLVLPIVGLCSVLQC